MQGRREKPPGPLEVGFVLLSVSLVYEATPHLTSSHKSNCSVFYKACGPNTLRPT